MKKAIIVISMLLMLNGCSTKVESVETNSIEFNEVKPESVEMIREEIIEEPEEIEIEKEETIKFVEEIIIDEHADKRSFRVTAYCACEKCCGYWATIRPLDENGKPIVYGASGAALISGISCASPLPFGTNVYLEGIGTVNVQDRIAQWVVDKYGENLIDIYFDTHEEAVKFALKYVDGVIL